jgi:YgiT-type zinc finger domain-containing protein
MKCHSCGASFERIITDLPFKTGGHSIVIIKDLPILQCSNCNEYLIEDSVMAAVERTIAKTSNDVEVEILRYAA